MDPSALEAHCEHRAMRKNQSCASVWYNRPHLEHGLGHAFLAGTPLQGLVRLRFPTLAGRVWPVAARCVQSCASAGLFVFSTHTHTHSHALCCLMFQDGSHLCTDEYTPSSAAGACTSHILVNPGGATWAGAPNTAKNTKIAEPPSRGRHICRDGHTLGFFVPPYSCGQAI